LSYYTKFDNSPVEPIQEVQKTGPRHTASLKSQYKVHTLVSS